MDRFSRIVLGYHGCVPEFAEAILRGELPLSEWQPSQNPYDWLGHGFYFWEYAPARARAWGEGGLIGAVIQLGRCLDLTDTRYTDLLASTDPWPNNPGEKKGLLTVAQLGKGTWTYVGLGLWRQLPAGTQGAYRIMANLISRPRSK